jgi:hypothetical protein
MQSIEKRGKIYLYDFAVGFQAKLTDVKKSRHSDNFF